MSSVHFRPAARQDLAGIWDYTLDAWGVDQAEAYVRQISKRCMQLANNRDLGLACDDVRPGYRKSIINKHVIFYRSAGDGIEVVRILHGRMDVGIQFVGEHD